MSTRALVLSWLLFTALLGGYGAFRFTGRNQSVYLPGVTSNGHYQIEMACRSCHTPFGGVTDEACLKCHAEARDKADSHPESKFNDPRNADRVAKIDARKCTTCHTEHFPEATDREGFTLPKDYCVECHADVGTERPSHAGIAFTTCSDGGCHNYHDNRALWEDYLKKHIGEPPLFAVAKVPVRGVLAVANAAKPLVTKDQDAPRTVKIAAAMLTEWEESAHAKAGVNCSGCHGGVGSAPWVNTPTLAICASCHAGENKGFREGKHGMRLAADLSPMSPGLARLPMKADAKERELGCHSCHASHRYDAKEAAVASCLGCHDDQHSQAYGQSPHFKLWQAEIAGTAEAGTGVSCATCHLPRMSKTTGQGVMVQHDQNDNLRPNEKMVLNVCTSCHGVGFSLDAMADAELVRKNFNGRPSKHVASVDMVEKRAGQGKR